MILDDKLNAPYAAVPDQGMPVDQVDAQLGFRIPNLTRLEEVILDDLSPDSHGISWWDQTSWSHRILVSDYIFTSNNGVRRGLREATLHLSELTRTTAEVEKRHRQHAVQNTPGMPPPKCLRDELESELLDLHIAGFFRALATSLDCLASLLVGVVPLPRNIRKIAWRDLNAAFDKVLSGSAVSHADHALRSVVEDLQRLLVESVPIGWIDWVVDSRNMLLHRPPRIRYGAIDLGSKLSIAKPSVEQLRITNRLWLHPHLSEIEVWIEYGSPLESLLNEPQELTLSRLIDQSAILTNNICNVLFNHWCQRRGDPSLLPQPVELQWPERERTSASQDFQGFMPQHPPAEATAMMVPPNAERRILAASVDGNNIHRWDQYVGRVLPRHTRIHPQRSE